MASLDFWTTHLLPVTNEEWMAAAAGGAAGYLYLARQLRGIFGGLLSGVLRTQQAWQLASAAGCAYVAYKTYVLVKHHA